MGERSRISLDTSWARKPAAQAVREVIIMGLLGPVIDYYVEPQTEGADLFDSLKPPVLFASNYFERNQSAQVAAMEDVYLEAIRLSASQQSGTKSSQATHA